MTRLGEKFVMWAAGDDDTVLRMTLEGFTPAEIAKVVGRSAIAVHCRRATLKGAMGKDEAVAFRQAARQAAAARNPSLGPDWTAEEVARVVADFSAGLTARETADALGRTFAAVQTRLKLLRDRGALDGLVRGKRARPKPAKPPSLRPGFTAAEDDRILADWAAGVPIEETADSIGRSVTSVATRKVRLKKMGRMAGLQRAPCVRPVRVKVKADAPLIAPRRIAVAPAVRAGGPSAAAPAKLAKPAVAKVAPTHAAPPFRPDGSHDARALGAILDDIGYPAPFNARADWRLMNDHLAGIALETIAARLDVSPSAAVARLRVLIAPVNGAHGLTLARQRLLIDVLRARATAAPASAASEVA